MMVFLILFLFVLAWVLIRANINRGKNFVRSFYYLLCLKNGKSAEEANHLARGILTSISNSEDDRRLTKMASDFSQENYHGKQRPIIHKAATKGFII